MDDYKNMSMEELLDELIYCGREQQMYPDSGRGDTSDIKIKIEAIKQEITNKFYSGEKI